MINNYQKCQIRKRPTIGLRSHSHAALISLIFVFHTPCAHLAWVHIPWLRDNRLILMLKRGFELFSNIFTSFCHTVVLVNNNSMLFLGKFLFFILCSPPVFFQLLPVFTDHRLLFRSLNLLLLLGKEEEGTPKVVQDGRCLYTQNGVIISDCLQETLSKVVLLIFSCHRFSKW